MRKARTLSLWISLFLILAAVLAIRPPVALADTEGITPTPTDTQAPPTPTDTPVVPSPTPPETIVPPPPSPTPTITSTPDPNVPPPTQPSRRPTATSVPILPPTGEIPPDGPFGGSMSLAVLLAGVAIGLVLGLGGRKLLFARAGKWLSRFLS